MKVFALLYLWVGFLHWLIAGGWSPWHFIFWYPAEYYLGWKQRRDENEQRSPRMAAAR